MNNIWKLKGCARCGGDMYFDRDAFGWFAQCLQCSYTQELELTQGQLKAWHVDPLPDAAVHAVNFKEEDHGTD